MVVTSPVRTAPHYETPMKHGAELKAAPQFRPCFIGVLVMVAVSEESATSNIGAGPSRSGQRGQRYWRQSVKVGLIDRYSDGLVGFTGTGIAGKGYSGRVPPTFGGVALGWS